MKDPAEALDDGLKWWEDTGRKYFWGWVVGVWTMIIAVEAVSYFKLHP